MLLAGVLAVGSGGLTLGGLVAFVSYVLMLTFPLEILAWIMALAGRGRDRGRARLRGVRHRADDRRTGPVRVAIEDVRGEIRFEGVSFALRGQRAARARRHRPRRPAGRDVAVVGATGSGKTTLVTLLTRLYDPTEGRITLDGHDLRDLTVTSLRRHVGFAFEEPSLFSASVRENLLMGKPDATEDEVLAALEVAQAGFALDLPWGLDTRIGEQGLSLSGGQRQRLALARADHRAAADPRARRPALGRRRPHRGAAQDALRPLLEDCTVFLVVHRPSTVALADRVVLLDEGRLVAVGTHHDLLDDRAPLPRRAHRGVARR